MCADQPAFPALATERLAQKGISLYPPDYERVEAAGSSLSTEEQNDGQQAAYLGPLITANITRHGEALLRNIIAEKESRTIGSKKRENEDHLDTMALLREAEQDVTLVIKYSKIMDWKNDAKDGLGLYPMEKEQQDVVGERLEAVKQEVMTWCVYIMNYHDLFE